MHHRPSHEEAEVGVIPHHRMHKSYYDVTAHQQVLVLTDKLRDEEYAPPFATPIKLSIILIKVL